MVRGGAGFGLTRPPASCAGGRWGRRRTRVTECYSLIRAEDSIHRPPRGRRLACVAGCPRKRNTQHRRPGAFFRMGDSFQRGLEVRAVFLRCPQCRSRCTRLYLPLETSWPACRNCWGLTYQSRTLYNYKNSLWGRWLARLFGTSQRDWHPTPRGNGVRNGRSVPASAGQSGGACSRAVRRVFDADASAPLLLSLERYRRDNHPPWLDSRKHQDQRAADDDCQGPEVRRLRGGTENRPRS